MDGLPIQVLIGIIMVAGSGVSVYLGLRIANAENQKDIEYMRVQIKHTDDRLTKHVDDVAHPSRVQIDAIRDQIEEIKRNDEKSHNRIEEKLDRLVERILAISPR